MATDAQRFTDICNALVDGVASLQQRTELATALVATATNDQIEAVQANGDRAALTDQQKASVALGRFLDFAREEHKKYRVKVAKLTAENTASPF